MQGVSTDDWKGVGLVGPVGCMAVCNQRLGILIRTIKS